MKEELEGYLYSVPLVGDVWFIAERKVREQRRVCIILEELHALEKEGNAVCIDDVLGRFRGRKVRITIQVIEGD